MDAREASQLVLDLHDRCLAVPVDSEVTLGSEPTANLTVRGDFASRVHARIEYRNQFYVLVDCSTNGTFIQTEDEQVTFVRRGESRLWGNGWIALGEPLTPETAIRFRHT
jgi:adenylate cyclase